MISGYAWKIGNGKKVRIANMRWVQGSVPEMRSDLLLRDVGSGMVKDLILSNPRQWNAAMVRERFVWETAKKILEMELPNADQDDFLFWNSHSSGNYTVKSGYAFLMQSFYMKQGHGQDDVFFKLIWGLNIPPKWSLFLWKLVMNGLAVKSNLRYRGVDIEGDCDSCGMEEEDLQHLFRLCSFARYALQNCDLHISSEIDESIPLRHWIQQHILLYHSEDGRQSARLHVFIGVLWSLWLTRNGRVFRNERGYLADYYRHYGQTMSSLEIFLKPRERYRDSTRITGRTEELPPGFNRFNIGSRRELPDHPLQGNTEVIIMVDGSWKKSTGAAGFRWAYSSDGVKLLEGGGDYGTAISALHTELLACIGAIKWASRKGYQYITIFTDSMAIIQLLRYPTSREVRILWTIEDLLKEGGSLDMCTIWKVSRDQLTQAHNIAVGCRCNLMKFSL
ncbi:uncharacterized protein LOC110726663 [Chenopodium quinoa]|uniref:uncharacterized protein LOC110726663 n=1 Tax=Chenopodium quinoa TaxID=63459 RepID=UPI000B783327|nr:uncharacterized protein LOC110726663 [Chenopodium quinoa]